MILPSTVSIVSITIYFPSPLSYNMTLSIFNLAIGTEVPFCASIHAPVYLVE
jgi:hypothetical protein